MYLIIDKENNQCVGIGNNLTELRDSCARVLALEQARLVRKKYEIQFNVFGSTAPVEYLGTMEEVLNNG